MITSPLRSFITSVTELAVKANDGDDTTVAAGLLTASGAIITGVNYFHFLGGPCAEVTALANHATQCPDDPIRAVVAVYGPTGNVIAPCGKCRQMLFDKDPSIQVIVRTPVGLEALPVEKLLPHAFNWRAEELPQRLYMWEGYEAAICDGFKEQTIRVDDPFTPGPATIVFEKESGKTVTIPCQVTEVKQKRRIELTNEDAERDGFADLQQLQEALDFYYPGLAPDVNVNVVAFRL